MVPLVTISYSGITYSVSSDITNAGKVNKRQKRIVKDFVFILIVNLVIIIVCFATNLQQDDEKIAKKMLEFLIANR